MCKFSVAFIPEIKKKKKNEAILNKMSIYHSWPQDALTYVFRWELWYIRKIAYRPDIAKNEFWEESELEFGMNTHFCKLEMPTLV